jgi:hypothetical protein
MGLLSWLKKPSTAEGVTKLASTVVAAYNPALGSLVQIVGTAVYQVELDMGDTAASATKQNAAVGIVAAATVTAAPQTKAAAVTVSIPGTINAVVSLFNTLGIFLHKSAPASASSNAPAAAK